MVNFLKYRWLYFIISFLVLLVGFYSIFRWGFHFSIEFVGGTNLSYSLNKDIDKEKIRKVINKNNIDLISLEKKGKVIKIKSKTISEKKERLFKSDLEKTLKVKVNVLKSETIGPILGKETVEKTIIASLIATIGILLYIGFAFRNFNFALAAVIAMFHDFFILLGTYSILSHFYGAEVDTLFVTAVLTTMSFSVHDTIVVFDKIREYRNKEGASIDYYANKALTETMVRSFNNSITIVFMLLALVLLGGSTIKLFAMALLIGTIAGTYSSPFVATPIAVWLEKRKKR